MTTISAADKIAADIEFTCMLEETLRDGHVVSMSSLEDAHVSILTANNVKNIVTGQTWHRKLKQLIQSEVSGVSATSPSQCVKQKE